MLDDRRTAAISEDQIVFRYQPPKRIFRIFFNSRQSGWRVHVPESTQDSLSGVQCNFSLQQLIVSADAAMLDYQICILRLFEHTGQLLRRGIHQTLQIAIVIVIAPLLPAVDVRFSERDFMTQCSEMFVDAAIVSSGSVPVRRSNTGTEDKYFHCESSSTMPFNCCARCMQVWRLRIVSIPFAAICRRAFSSRNRCSISAVMALLSETQT